MRTGAGKGEDVGDMVGGLIKGGVDGSVKVDGGSDGGSWELKLMSGIATGFGSRCGGEWAVLVRFLGEVDLDLGLGLDNRNESPSSEVISITSSTDTGGITFAVRARDRSLARSAISREKPSDMVLSTTGKLVAVEIGSRAVLEFGCGEETLLMLEDDAA